MEKEIKCACGMKTCMKKIKFIKDEHTNNFIEIVVSDTTGIYPVKAGIFIGIEKLKGVLENG